MKIYATSPISFSGQVSLVTRLWLAFLLIISAAVPARAVNTFESVGTLATARRSHTATLLHTGKVLVAGGYNTSSGPLLSTEIYDPRTGIWSNIPGLGTARYGHTTTLLPNGKALVTGGYGLSGASLASAELFDPAGNGGAGSWSVTGGLVTARAFHSATLLANGKVLVAGGNNNAGPFASVELYDPVAGTWSATGSMAAARQSHTATMLPDGKVLVAGGGDGIGTFFTSAETYNPSSGTWSATGALSDARAFHTATLLANGKVIAVGGQTTGFGGLATAQSYDPATGVWTITASLATARYGHSATLMPNGNLLVAGGQTTGGGFLASAQLYDRGSGFWVVLPINLSSARAFHTATMLASGAVLVSGGVDGNGALTNAELFNSGDDAWRAAGYLATPRLDHSATLLPNGKVLVAGGYYTDLSFLSHPLASAEIYDPATGAWTAAGALSGGRYRHTATLLPNGKVLVAAGTFFGPNNIPQTLASTELYDPVSGSWSATGSLATERFDHTATLLPDGKVLVVGGTNTNGTVATAELYDPAIGAWSPTGAPANARHAHTATLLPNGKVLIVGGSATNTVPSGLLASTELYDPVTGGWTPTGALATARYVHTATLLVTGKVLVAGGYPGGSIGSELYDPATGIWSPTASTTSRLRHTATLLPNGKVLFVGGAGNQLDPGPGNAELYDQATGITATAYPRNARDSHTATLLPNGKVLIAGGFWYFDFDDFIEYDHDSAELYDVGVSFYAPWQPQITSASFDMLDRFVLKGTDFRGISSASGGNGSQDSPTNYPIVQVRRTESEQSTFVSPDPGIAVSATAFTSTPIVPAFTSGHAEVRVFANGIPSAAFGVLIGFPSIAVELPGGTVIPDGGTHSFTSVLGTPTRLIFTIRNRGSVSLTGLTITKDGANAEEFTLTISPTTPVLPGGTTTFTAQFSSAAAGAKSAALHIANNVAGFQSYDINLTGNPLALSFTQDTDGDGMSDAAEVQLAAQGFEWQVSQPGLVATYYGNANGMGLFTTDQVQALNIDVPLIQRNPATGAFKLTIGVKKSPNLLLPFTDFPMNQPGFDAFINGQGKLEFEFASPDNAAFFRLESR